MTAESFFLHNEYFGVVFDEHNLEIGNIIVPVRNKQIQFVVDELYEKRVYIIPRNIDDFIPLDSLKEGEYWETVDNYKTLGI